MPESSAPEPVQDPIREILKGVTDPSQMSPGKIDELRLLAVSEGTLEIRLSALYLLGKLAKPSEYQVLQAMLACLDDGDEQVRRAAARNLVGWRGRAVPAMLQALRESEDVRYRSRLIVLIGHIGLDAATAKPTLKALTSDADLGTLAKETLPKLDPGLRQFWPWLFGIVQDWAMVGSLLVVALLLITEFARPFQDAGKGLIPLLTEDGPGRPLRRGLVVGGLLGLLTLVQFVRAMLRYDRPDKPSFTERTASAWSMLLALLLLITMMSIALWRLESLRG